MDDKHKYWLEDGKAYGWVMPSAPWWRRLPIIRHIRAIRGRIAVARHNAFWIYMGKIPSGYDNWVLYGIWHGLERKA